MRAISLTASELYDLTKNLGLTPQEFAMLLGVSVSAIYKWLNEGTQRGPIASGRIITLLLTFPRSKTAELQQLLSEGRWHEANLLVLQSCKTAKPDEIRPKGQSDAAAKEDKKGARKAAKGEKIRAAKKSQAKKAAPKKATPKKATPKKATPKKATPKKAPAAKPAKKAPAAKPAKKAPAAKPAKKTPAAKPAKKSSAAKPAQAGTSTTIDEKDLITPSTQVNAS